MKHSGLRLEPELPGLEAEYRQFYLHNDINQIIILVLLWALPYTVFAYSDYQFYGLGLTFYRLFALRVIYVWICLLLAYILARHTFNYRTFDLLTAIWVALSIFWTIIVSLSQSLDFVSSSIVGLIALFSFYVFVPNRLPIRIIPPLLYSAFAVYQVYRLHDILMTSVFYAVVFSYLLTNLIGSLFSMRFYASRRKEFQSRVEEEKARNELQRLASTDPLTGVLNRRWLLELANEAFYRFRRYRRPFSILVMDLDGFKTVNDTFGHHQGDTMLVEFTQRVVHEKRTIDAFGRMGGDEFCLILPETLPGEASVVAERILQNCRSLVASDGMSEVSVTVSIGISQVHPQDPSLDALFARADQALYASKHQGRDRWEIV